MIIQPILSLFSIEFCRYMPVESSLEKLVKDSVKPGVVPVKKYEYDEKENTVVMYFNDMPKEKSCWTFQTKRDNAVGDLQVGSNSQLFS